MEVVVQQPQALRDRGSLSPQRRTVSHIMCRRTELLQLQSSFHIWCRFAQVRRQQIHMKRCAVVLRHSNNRREYGKFFTRWLAAAQQRASSEARKATVIPRDVPLRSKRDYLSLVARYYEKWRQHIRSKRQQTVTNVNLLEQKNTERIQYKVLLVWQQACIRGLAKKAIGHEFDNEHARLEAQRTSEELSHLQSSYDEVVNTLRNSQEAAQKLEKENKSLRASVEEQTQRAREAETQLRNAQRDLQKLRSDLKDEKDSLSQSLHSLQSQARQSEGDLRSAQRESQRLSTDLAKLQETSSATDKKRQAEIELLRAAAIEGIKSLSAASPHAEHTRYVGKPTDLPDTSQRHSKAIADALLRSLSSLHSSLGNSSDAGAHEDFSDDSTKGSTVSDVLMKLREQAKEKEAEVIKAKRDMEELQGVVDDMVAWLAHCTSEECMGTTKRPHSRHPLHHGPESHSYVEGIADRLKKISRENGDGTRHAVGQFRDMLESIVEEKRELGKREAAAAELRDSAVAAIATFGDDSSVAHLSSYLENSTEYLSSTARTLGDIAQEVKAVMIANTKATEPGLTDSAHVSEILDTLWSRQEELERNLADALRTLHGLEQLSDVAMEALDGGALLPDDAVAQCIAPFDGKKDQQGLVDLLQKCVQVGQTLQGSQTQAKELVELQGGATDMVNVLGGPSVACDELPHTMRNLATLIQESLQESGHGSVLEALDTIDKATRDADTLRGALDIVNEMVLNPLAPQTHSRLEIVRESASQVEAPITCLDELERVRVSALESIEGLPSELRNEHDGVNTLSLVDMIVVLCKWKNMLLQDMKEAIQVNSDQEAIGVFLRDVLRDAATRIQVAMPVGMELSVRASVTFDPASLGPLVPADPSQYVEAILQNGAVGDENGRRAVQTHLRENAAIGSSFTGPSTWDVVAELHDRLVLMVNNIAQHQDVIFDQTEQADLLVQQNEALKGAMEEALDCLQAWPGGEDIPEVEDDDEDNNNHSLMGLASKVSHTLSRLKKRVTQAVIQDDPLSYEQSPSTVDSLVALEAAVDDICSRLNAWQASAKDGIAALGGEKRASPLEEPDASISVRDRLVAICHDTGTSIEEVRTILGVPAQAETIRLSEIIPSIRTKVHEMDEARRETEYLVGHLDVAFDDDSLGSSITSHKTLKPKKKPLPALEGSASVFFLTHRDPNEMTGSTSTQPSTPYTAEERMKAFRVKARAKLHDVYDLSQMCRTLLSILDGSYEEGKKPPVYGSVITSLLMSQVEDFKKVIPICDEALYRKGSSTGGSNSRLSVGVRMQQLATLVQSLTIERDGLRDELTGRGRQNVFLMNDLEGQAERHKARVSELHDQISTLEKHEQVLSAKLKSEQQQADELKRASEELKEVVRQAEAAMNVDKKDYNSLAQTAAVQQHESNVLVECLARAISAIITSEDVGAAKGEGGMEQVIRRYLKSQEGEPLLEFVSRHADAAQKQLNALRCQYAEELQSLREALSHLRSHVTGGDWQKSVEAMCVEHIRQREEEFDLIRIENDLLRPRAQEREVLRKENRELRSSVTALRGNREGADARLSALTAEISSLRCALREAQMEQIIRSIPQDSLLDDIQRARQQQQQQQSSATLDVLELERRMIRGATSLTVEAIESLTGESVAATVGLAVEETLMLRQRVEACVAELRRAYDRSPRGDAFVLAVDAQMIELEKLSTVSQYLLAKLPVLFHSPYQVTA